MRGTVRLAPCEMGRGERSYMRKTILWSIVILAVILLLAYWQNVLDVLHAMSQGALGPLVCATFFEFGRYAFQSKANVDAFEAVGETASWSKMMQLIMSGNFVNTLVPSGGTVYYALVIDDANDRGIPVGKSTSASLMMQMFLLAGFIVIMLVGFTIMQAAGTLTLVFFLCGMFIVVLVGFFGAMLFICRRSPSMLRSFLRPIENFVSKVAVKVRRSHKPPKPWADRFVDQLYAATQEMSAHRKQAWICFIDMIIANGLEMCCFIMVGFAFDVTALNALLCGYVITHIFTIVSPSPNGVGVAEATAALVLTSFGVPVPTSTAIALTYRGFVFWIPFVIGAMLLGRTGFFQNKDESEQEKAKQIGHLAALFALVFGLSNIIFALLPNVPESFNLLSQWLSMGNVFSASLTILFSVMLLLMTRGLRKRSRTTWAFTMLLLVYLAVSQFVGARTVYSGIAILVFAAWLFIRRSCFDQLLVYENSRSTISPILYCLCITLGYGICGFWLLSDQFSYPWSSLPVDVVVATIQTLLPMADPTPLTDQATWFIGSVRMVGAFTVTWAIVAILFPWIRRQRYEGRIDNNTAVWRAIQGVETGLLAGNTDEFTASRKAIDDAEKTAELRTENSAKAPAEKGDVATLTVDEQEEAMRSAEEDKILQDILLGLAERKKAEQENAAILDRLSSDGNSRAEKQRVRQRKRERRAQLEKVPHVSEPEREHPDAGVHQKSDGDKGQDEQGRR
jgi:phosphatidylglycerol lysyltransferase